MVGNAKAYAKTARTASVAIPRFRSPAAKPNSSSGSLGESPGRRPHQPASVSVVGRTINQSPYEYSFPPAQLVFYELRDAIRRRRFVYGDEARASAACGGFKQETVRAENAMHHLLKHGRKSRPRHSQGPGAMPTSPGHGRPKPARRCQRLVCLKPVIRCCRGALRPATVPPS